MKNTHTDTTAQLRALLASERDTVANLAQFSSFVFHTVQDINWAGFYLLRGNQLVLGPFQGKVACTRIALGQGVCGTAALRRETLIVPDVHAFPGHIVCDSASKSEMVVPMMKVNRPIGVFDLDSESLNRFDEMDRVLIESWIHILTEATDFN